MSDDKPTIEEQYAIAISTGTGFERVMLAAGLQRDAIVGAKFLRLRAEYDQVRGDMERSGQIAPRAAEKAGQLKAEIDRIKALMERTDLILRADHLADQIEAMSTELAAIQRRAPAEIMSARAFVLLGLCTLGDARTQLGALAVKMGAAKKHDLAPEVALKLAGRVLDVWLDEVCHRCDGTKAIGNRYAGDRERECPTCKGSGHRRDILGDSLKQTMFAADLMAEVHRQVAAAAAGIKAALYREEAAAKPLHPELQRRLDDLRGVEAARD